MLFLKLFKQLKNLEYSKALILSFGGGLKVTNFRIKLDPHANGSIPSFHQSLVDVHYVLCASAIFFFLPVPRSFFTLGGDDMHAIIIRIEQTLCNDPSMCVARML